jgi:hypothetical protein
LTILAPRCPCPHTLCVRDQRAADGRNVRLEYRWGSGDAERIRTYAAELVALVPDVILALLQFKPDVIVAEGMRFSVHTGGD